MHKKFMTGLSAAALVLATSAPSFAGGFGDADVEPDVFVVDQAAAGSFGGLGGTGVLIGVLAIAGLAALASSDDTEEDSDTSELR